MSSSSPHTPGADTLPQLPDYLRKLYPFRHSFLTLEREERLHYLDEGTGVPVVMLHGNPTWSYFYRDMVKGLADTHRCIVPDHIGCGLSDKPQDYDYRLARHIENVQKLLEHLGINRFHLVMHDWGGAIGMGLATAQPDRVISLTVMNTAAFRSQRMPFRIALCRLPVLGELAVRGFNAFAGGAKHMAPARRLSREVREGFIYPYGTWHDRIATHRFVKDIPLSPKHPSYPKLLEIEQGLQSLRDKPMLICWGLQDWCFDPVFLREWCERFPDATVLRLPHAAHYLLEDAGDEIIPRVRAFVSKVG